MSAESMRHALAKAAAAAVTGVAVMAIAITPAIASKKPTARPTSITVKAAKSAVAPKHKDSFVATLKSGHARLANEQLCLTSRTKTSSGWSKWGTCTNLSDLTNSKGQAAITTVVPGNSKGEKTQYEIEFAGISGSYRASHSRVITVTTR